MNRIFSVGKSISALLLAIFLIFVAADVFTRNVLHLPVIWLNEGSVFAFLWMAFISGAVAFSEDMHYKVSILPEGIEKKAGTALVALELLAIAVFGIVLLAEGWKMTVLSIKSFSPALGICMAWVLMVMPISAVGILLSAASRTYSLIRKPGEGR